MGTARSGSATDACPSAIVFGIVMATFRRSNDPRLYLVGNTSLKSIAQQAFGGWKLFIGGDALSDEEIDLLFAQLEAAGVPLSRAMLINIDHYDTERAIYTDRMQRWRNGGTAATNAALRYAYADASITHISWMGDDDVMLPEHLGTLAGAFCFGSNVGFAHSRAKWLERDRVAYYPVYLGDASIEYLLQPPKPCGLIAASSSWSKRFLNNVYLRQEFEQAAMSGSRRPVPQSSGCDPTSGDLANDADLWERVYGFIELDRLFEGVVATRVTIEYMSSSLSAVFAQKLYGLLQ